MQMFLVGGVVRDELMGIPSNDWDFSVEAASFDAMRAELESQGFKIWLENPEFLTIRARGPKDWSFAGLSLGGQTADFVMARKDGHYTDGRRPDEVIPGTLMDDLSRRDFCMNAIAKTVDGVIIDPFRGQEDIRLRVIRTVGKPEDRLGEDALRGLRALRFSVTKDFRIHPDLHNFIQTRAFADSLRSVSKERQREEVEKMFKHSTIRAMEVFNAFHRVRDAVFADGLRLSATMRER